jgi:uncharacterized membrane protein
LVATEWSGGRVINLGGLPGSTDSEAFGVNDAGQAVGDSVVGGVAIATEWTGGGVINLGLLPGSTGSEALSVNDAGQVAGWSFVGEVEETATEWSDSSVINLGALPLPGFRTGSLAFGISNTGQVVGRSFLIAPEPSTWAMMLAAFAGLGLAGYRRAKATSPS